ncbi:MAG: DinB family protein [Candidatus Hodarchaeales archaeon]
MVYKFLIEAIHRHLEETELILNQLTDEVVLKEPVRTGRSLGEIVIHIIRSLEYYSQGLAKNIWEPLNYTLDKYPNAKSISSLYKDVVTRTKSHLESISPQTLDEVHSEGNRTATRAELLLELLEHSVQHRGQLLVYYRLLGLIPKEIPYII